MPFTVAVTVPESYVVTELAPPVSVLPEADPEKDGEVKSDDVVADVTDKE